MDGTSENKSMNSKGKDFKKVRSVIARYKNKSIDTSNMSYVSKGTLASVVSIKEENKNTESSIRNETE
jgi:hypothetical protein